MGKHHAHDGYLESDDNFYFQAKAIAVVELLERAIKEGRPIRLMWHEDGPVQLVEQTDVLNLPDNWDK
jgi:hypothetical protein